MPIVATRAEMPGQLPMLTRIRPPSRAERATTSRFDSRNACDSAPCTCLRFGTFLAAVLGKVVSRTLRIFFFLGRCRKSRLSAEFAVLKKM